MATSYQTPGVYIVEQNAFPNSVVPVATAIPAFIGFTEKTASTASQGQQVTMVATQINSLKDYESLFGTGQQQTFTPTFKNPLLAAPTVPSTTSSSPPFPVVTFHDKSAATGWLLTPDKPTLYLYESVQLFFQNGGGTCYIVSLGDYTAASSATAADFIAALQVLELEPDPTMVLCPDALLLALDQYYNVAVQMLTHCGKMQSRVALLDVYGGNYLQLTNPAPLADAITQFRTSIGLNYLNYGIAYYPWVNTSLLDATSVDFTFFSETGLTNLKDQLDANGGIKVPGWPSGTETDIFTEADNLLKYYTKTTPLGTSTPEELTEAIANLEGSLRQYFPDYKRLTGAITNYLNTLPVAPAMAGVITTVDTNIGVWQSPANVSLASVISPTISVSDETQKNLNVDAKTGKSINAIRTFTGQGTLVWGARTLAGNSQDWRYVSVRRTLIMLEQSIKLAARAYVFAPNVANTWTNVKSMITTFLYNIWRQGGLAGASPTEAFTVQVGLGVTMTANDILDGLMKVTVQVALVRPAEFIEIAFKQQMQTS